MPDVVHTLIDHKEVIGIVTGVAGVCRTAYDVIQSRSRAAKRDKLLLRIQGLSAAEKALASADLGDRANDFGLTKESVAAEMLAALAELAAVSRRVEEKQVADGELGLLQRVFLLYKPVGVRAWIAHILCWLSLLGMPFYLIATWFPWEGEGEGSFTTFVLNWKNPEVYFGGLFYLGLFLFARLWGLYERKRTLRKQPGPAPATVAAWLYGAMGVGLVVGAVAARMEDGTGGLRLGVFGVIVGCCGLTLGACGRLRDQTFSLTTTKALILLLPPVALALTIVFDIGGIVLKDFGHDLLGYWRAWGSEPILPLLFLPLAVIPVYAGVRCLQRARRPTEPNLARAA